jgi:UDP-N-acetyl-D-glucosamine dehydrogenase
MKDALLQKIQDRTAVVGVVGLGYVGLPLAVEVAAQGFSVIGVDINARTVDRVNRGESHIGDVPSDRLQALVSGGRIAATTDYAELARTDCISIAVPTPLRKTKEPDVSYITAAVDALLPHVRKGQLLVLESTTYPGTTDELIAQRISAQCGLTVGTDIFVAFSPERVDPGNEKWNTKNTPKVVGGVTPFCGEVTTAFYKAVVDTVFTVRSAREAETVKLLENTFRAVNIALVNEFLLMGNRMDIDIWNVIEAAATKPFGFMPFYPGPGIGGHCIPLDPMYMAWKAKSVDFYSRFIELATDLNGNMPRFVVTKLAELLNERERSIKGAGILLIGMAYKKNVDDLRESPGLELYRLFEQKGAKISFVDPHAKSFQHDNGQVISTIEATPEILSSFDACLLITDHDSFDYELFARSCPLILDCRGAFEKRGIAGASIVKL